MIIKRLEEVRLFLMNKFRQLAEDRAYGKIARVITYLRCIYKTPDGRELFSEGDIDELRRFGESHPDLSAASLAARGYRVVTWHELPPEFQSGVDDYDPRPPTREEMEEAGWQRELAILREKRRVRPEDASTWCLDQYGIQGWDPS